jgi:hypothetical protein
MYHPTFGIFGTLGPTASEWLQMRSNLQIQILEVLMSQTKPNDANAEDTNTTVNA